MELKNIIEKEQEFQKVVKNIKFNVEQSFNEIKNVEGMSSGKCFTINYSDLENNSWLPHNYSLTYQKNLLLNKIGKSSTISSIKIILLKVIESGKIELDDSEFNIYGKRVFHFNPKFVNELKKVFGKIEKTPRLSRTEVKKRINKLQEKK